MSDKAIDCPRCKSFFSERTGEFLVGKCRIHDMIILVGDCEDFQPVRKAVKKWNKTVRAHVFWSEL